MLSKGLVNKYIRGKGSSLFEVPRELNPCKRESRFDNYRRGLAGLVPLNLLLLIIRTRLDRI